MLIVSFLPIFLFSLLFFILILQLLDIFANLWRYLVHEATIAEIMEVALLYVPKCISYSIPAALLFSISYTLGTLYKNNELIAILGSGISFYRLVIPFIVISIILSVGSFIFEDRIVIDTLKRKSDLYRAVVNQTVSLSNTNVTVISGDTVYHVDYYNEKRQTITNVMIVFQDSEGRFRSRIDAEWGEWKGRNWVLHKCRIYDGDQERGLTGRRVRIYDAAGLTEHPSTFRRTAGEVEEMKRSEALIRINRLREAGLPYRGDLTEYYKKYFFALSPLIVALIAGGIGARFKRNILLMNLLAALVISIIYYVFQMITMILAKSAYIPPLAGAGSSFIIFLLTGLLMLKAAKT